VGLLESGYLTAAMIMFLGEALKNMSYFLLPTPSNIAIHLTHLILN